MEPGVADILLRSRQNVLDILDERGYDVSPYRNIAPDQILTMGEEQARALDIFARKKPGGPAPCERAVVLHMYWTRLRLRLGTFVRDVFDEFAGTPNEVRRTDDIIVILNEEYHEAFDKASIQMWQREKVRMTFFHIKQLVIHPGKHVLVPPHRKLTAEEAKAEMARLHISQRAQLPLIKHHDIQSRVLGLVPGDVVEVLRPSATAGVERYLRLCAA